MDDEEEDVFEPDSCCWHTTFGEIKCEDRGTQTPGPALARDHGMLPCGVAEEPRPLFNGNPGVGPQTPARFELGAEREARRRGKEREESAMEQRPAPWDMEAHIGQKLRLIGDRFHQEQLQLYHRNQRNPGPAWWRLASALLGLLFRGRRGAGRR